jgi:hypothetical protein
LPRTKGHDSVTSYLKTLALAGGALAFALALVVVGAAQSGALATALVALGVIAVLVMLPVLAGGMLVLRRERRRQEGLPDLFWNLTLPRREAGLDAPGGFRASFVRRLLARLTLGHDFLPGDLVEIRPLSEILATLDAGCALEGLPFQPEMVRFCGQRVRVFRCLDKIYDYGRTKRMRRLSGSVLLSGLRCDGAAHGGCEAECYLIWKTQWLRRVHAAADAAAASVLATPPQMLDATRDGDRYRCQFTMLHSCTREFNAGDWRKDLVPLISGNYALRPWLVAMLTRIFNAVQRRRGGHTWPPMPPVGTHENPAVASLAPGQRVVVVPIEAIARTLNRNGKNRGLWFDTDMIKHCGRGFGVHRSVSKIIDDATGEMRAMKTPCITLEGVDYSGEGLHFNAQHDPTFWREAWLQHAQHQEPRQC